MFRDNKRLSFRLRRLVRHLRRTRHAAVQDMTLHELHRGIRRSHGLKPPGAPAVSSHGVYRPLTRRAKQLLTRLRKARMWNVKKHLIAELAREMARGRRLADRVRDAAAAAGDRARGIGRGARRGARMIGRGARRAWTTARPHVNRIQERMLTRAERRQAARERSGRRPRTRRAVTAIRTRAARAAARVRHRKPPVALRARPAVTVRPARPPRTAAARPRLRPARPPRATRAPARTR